MKCNFKAIVSLLLVLTTLFSLTALVGCDTEQPNDGTATTTATTTAATTQAPTPDDNPQKLEWIAGGYISSFNGNPKDPGAVIEKENTYYTDVITIAEKGTTVTITDTKALGKEAFVVSSWKQVGDSWVLDPAGANFGATEKNGICAKDGDTVVFTYTTGQDNEHLRFSASSKAEVKMEVTGAAGSVETVFTANGKYSVLQNLRTSILGDSYLAKSSYPFVWTEKLTTRYDGFSYNHAKGGATVSTAHTTASSQLVYRFRNLMKATENPQIVIIEGGRNDFNKQVQIGSTDVSNQNPATFAGALNYIVSEAKVKYPDAMIVLITCWNFPNSNNLGLTYRSYADAMKTVAENHGVYLIYAADPKTVGVDMTSSSFKAQYSEKGNSISHLNEKGMEYVLPKFEKILAEYYLDFLEKKSAQ